MGGQYLFTKEGAQDALGLGEINEVTKKANEAIKFGFVPFVMKGGVEYYDLNVLLANWPVDQKLCRHIEKVKNEKIVEDEKNHTHSKLQLDFNEFLK